MANSPSWLSELTLKESKRSKRITLRISRQNGIELIIPPRTSKKRAFEFLQQKYEWVQKHLHLLITDSIQPALPTHISLALINEEWSVHRANRSLTKIREDRATCGLLLPSACTDAQAQLLLKRWLVKKAKQCLPALLTRLSEQHALPHSGVCIRLQRSRWGSCTKEKKINLNARLLLLPHDITEYILVHELVHTIHFDHSKTFWQAVSQIIPNHKVLRAKLKKIEQDLPNWVY